MSKRYYYTDPLAAAWMAKHFGMVFTILDLNDGCDVAVSPSDWGGRATLDMWARISKFYIHPDSLPLLEPEHGDLLKIVRGFCSYYKEVESTASGGTKKVTGVWSGGEHWDITKKEPLHDWEILQRNGVAFMWPESEGA